MTKQKDYIIRPSARLINTIGKDLVKDKFAAVVELVKNSFDADSPHAHITFKYDEEIGTLTISVADSGDGMNLDTVVNKWLVPATSDKLIRKTSPRGRSLQGRKGIGRFAAAALGNSIYLTTKAKNSTEVSLLIDLEDFSDDKLLEDIPIIIEEGSLDGDKGTFIEVVSQNISLDELTTIWDEKQRSKLIIELGKLLAPTEVTKTSKDLGYLGDADDFSVTLKFEGFKNTSPETIRVKPFGIIDLFDYRISGTIEADGTAEIEFFNQNIPSVKPEKFSKKLLFDTAEQYSYPGKLTFDLRVFDRDPESISQLIERGLKDPFSDEKVGKLKAKEILNEYYGISLFRGSFRIRPYGNRDVDWLELDKKRVQNPSMRIGHNQVIGFVGIQSEEFSNLEEKSAR
jgi:hypothetical protein